MFEAEAVEIQAQAENFAENQQYSDIEKECERVMFASAIPSQVAKIAGPSGGEQRDQERKTQCHVGNAEAAADAIVFASFRGVGLRLLDGKTHLKVILTVRLNALMP
jgi:hypothetical protein